MKAKIKLTIGNTVFNPGERIKKKLSSADETFLLREGYIEKEESDVKETGKTGEKASVSTETPQKG